MKKSNAEGMLLFCIYALLLISQAHAEITLIRSTATSLKWDVSDVVKSGKRYSIEVLLKAPTGDVRVIDGRLRTGAKTYTAFNLKSNKRYQLAVFEAGSDGNREDTVSAPAYTNLRCYVCNGAPSAEYCTDIQECPASNRQCFTQVRYYSSNGRSRFYIFKGCTAPKDLCATSKKRSEVMQYATSATGDLTSQEVLDVMPGLKFFGDVDDLLRKSPSLMQKAKEMIQKDKDEALENAIKKECARGKQDENDFCRCCCSGERCNHALLDCGMTPPPEILIEEALPPDIATAPPETTAPILTPRKIPHACKDFNGGCDHICMAVNKTAAKCACLDGYTLQSDGKSCSTHLKHAVANAGPDITVTLPRASVIISAKETKGAVRMYKWWDPIAIGGGGSLTVSDPYERDLTVTNLNAGTYRFILMVTGMDGRRTSDSMKLIVLLNPSLVNASATAKPAKTRRPRVGLLSFNRFSSPKQRDAWKNSGNRYEGTDEEPDAKGVLKLHKPVTTPKPTKLIFTIITGRPRGSKRRFVTKPWSPKIPRGGRRRATTTKATTTTPAPVTCPALEVDTRQVTAVCTNSNIEGSECQFECEGGMTLQGGSESATCGEHEGTVNWLSELKPISLPCCQLACPASAYADVYFLIHSATRTGRLDWRKILNLANNMVNEFNFGDGGVCVGAARYFRAVDEKTALPLDCSRTKAQFKAQLLKLPSNGFGTNTISGLNYLQETAFSGDANRRKAQDVAIIITTSRSTGRVNSAAQALKASGVKVLAIGVKTKAGTPNLLELRTMASTRTAAINLPRIPPVVSPAIKKQLQDMVCDKECNRY